MSIIHGPRFIDLTGQQFGLLTVIEYAGKRGRLSGWKCVCQCGESSIVTTSHLRSGHTRSCGCLNDIQRAIAKTTVARAQFQAAWKSRRNGVVRVPLSQGKVAFIDEEDAERVLQHKWSARLNPKTGTWYARRAVWQNPVSRNVQMHRFILDAPPDKQVDHVDGDGLNNRRNNLRLATNRQNHQNMKRQTNKASSVFKGVFSYVTRKDKCRRWIVQIRAHGKTERLSGFETEEAAARAYDAKAKEYFGDFAWLNFPE